MKLGITIIIYNKDDIEFVTEFPCFLGHPVYPTNFFSNSSFLSFTPIFYILLIYSHILHSYPLLPYSLSYSFLPIFFILILHSNILYPTPFFPYSLFLSFTPIFLILLLSTYLPYFYTCSFPSYILTSTP